MKRRRSHSADKQPPAPRTFAFPGLWRDGNYLVIDEDEHHFPRRCLKTNEPVEAPTETITFVCYNPTFSDLKDFSPQQKTEILLPNQSYQNRRMAQYSVSLRVPLTPRWRWILSTYAGLFAAVAGLFLTYFAHLLLDSREFEPSPWRPLWWLLWGGSIALVLAGLVLMAFVSWSLSIRHMSDGKIWIGGVHRDWLQPLPEYVPSRRTLEHEAFRGAWQLWTYAALGVFFVSIVLAAAFVGANRDRGYHEVIVMLLIATAVALFLGTRGTWQARRARRQLTKLYPNKRRKRRKP